MGRARRVARLFLSLAVIRVSASTCFKRRGQSPNPKRSEHRPSCSNLVDNFVGRGGMCHGISVVVTSEQTSGPKVEFWKSSNCRIAVRRWKLELRHGLGWMELPCPPQSPLEPTEPTKLSTRFGIPVVSKRAQWRSCSASRRAVHLESFSTVSSDLVN